MIRVLIILLVVVIFGLVVWLMRRRPARTRREETREPAPGRVNLGKTAPALQELRRFTALGSDLTFEWNTPFGKVKEALTQRGVRSLEEHGLRGATAAIEQIAGRAALKDVSGSY